jgi:hypothetical protein
MSPEGYYGDPNDFTPQTLDRNRYSEPTQPFTAIALHCINSNDRASRWEYAQLYREKMTEEEQAYLDKWVKASTF